MTDVCGLAPGASRFPHPHRVRSRSGARRSRAATKLRWLLYLYLMLGVSPLERAALAATPAIDAVARAESDGAALVAQWLAAAGIDPSTDGAAAVIGLEVRRLDDGAPLLRHAAAPPMNPASVIKLLPTLAALETLGADYRWRTRWFLDGPLVRGRLRGNLVLEGGGDPKLVIEDLRAIVAGLRAAGLARIDGDLVVDDGLYAVPSARGEAFDGEPLQPYNVLPMAAMMNFKSTKFVYEPRAKTLQVTLDPPLAGVRIDNRVRLASGRCRFGAGDVLLEETGSTARPVLRLTGQYSRRCGRQEVFWSVLDHRQFIDGVFRAAWQEAGGVWNGRTRIDSGAASRLGGGDARPFFVWESPRTLVDVVQDINQFSNNVMSRQISLHLATLVRGRAASEADGAQVIEAWLARRGVQAKGLVFDNGAGLSRDVRIATDSVVALLLEAARGPHASLLRASLPEVGGTGTMRLRLRGTPVVGNAWLKTGSLDDVRAIAGYVRARSGVEYAIACVYNGPGARRSLAVQDELLKWVWENG